MKPACVGQGSYKEANFVLWEPAKSVHVELFKINLLTQRTNFLASAPLFILCGYFAITDAAFL